MSRRLNLFKERPMKKNAGFTLIELLVVIAIIVVLVALLLPAVQAARESARLVSCRNKMKQIGLALSNYENVHRVLPPSSTSRIDFGVWSPDPTQYHLQSWASLILPFLEQQAVETQINYNVSALDPLNRQPAAQILSAYRCPSYAGPDFSQSPLYLALSDRYAIRNYAGMGATTVGKLYTNPDGVFYAGAANRITDVRDGTTTTIFIVETREPNAAVWIDGGTAAITSHAYDDSNAPNYALPQIGLNQAPYFRPINGQGIDCQYGPSSMHSGGATHLFGDSSVQFLSDKIDGRVYDALVTREGQEIVQRGDY
jgi:prepilin-type N-terminal cleavage/methylation domain-containing protein